MGSDFEDFESPAHFRAKIPLSESAKKIVDNTRKKIIDIFNRKSFERIFIVGPCSIHNYGEALEYAKKLSGLSEKVKNKILILMRVYLEKPRTNIGWKGFINDPDLDNSFDISKGIELSRKLLNEINKRGLGIATEFLDVLVYPYIYDFISFAAIGARTTESQAHRQFVSGLEIPVGFKNLTSGDIEAPINAIKTASNLHCFLGIDENGRVSKIKTSGNENCCLILRGGYIGPNYEKDFVKEVEARLEENNFHKNIIIDCSHGNSMKDYRRQREVFKDVIGQMKENRNIIGAMLESNLEEGRQSIPENPKDLKRGVSVTDSCIGWLETEKLIMFAYNSL